MNNRFHFEGARIFYRSQGSGSPLLFFHNGGASHRIWEHQVERFSKTHRCIAFDLPGFGASTSPGLRTNLRFHVEWLEAFCSIHRIQGATLVGNCMGSAIALAYAKSFPKRVQRLVLFHVLTKSTVIAGPYATLFTRTTPKMRQALRSFAMRLTTPRIFLKATLRAHWGSRGEPDAALAAELTRLYRRRGQLAALADLLCDVDAFAALDRLSLSESSPRTLMIWGEANKVLPYSAGQALARALEPHEVVSIPNGGHLVMHEQFTRTNRIMEEFFDAHRDADRDCRQARP